MELILLRHGEVISKPAHPSAAGELSPLGEQQIAAAAATLRLFSSIPERIFVSPLERARQSAVIVSRMLNVPAIESLETLSPESDPRQVISLLKLAPHGRVMLVGHEPNLRGLMSMLLTGSRNLPVRVSYGSLACIETGGTVGAGTGMLKFLMTHDQTARFAEVLSAGLAGSGGA